MASKRLTHRLHWVSSGLCLHGRLPQLLGQLPHAVLHPFQEDLPQHHAGLGKGVHFLAPFLQARFQVAVSQFASVSYHCCSAVTKGPKTFGFARPSVCLAGVIRVLCRVEVGLASSLFSLQTPNWILPVWTYGKVLEGDRGLGSCREGGRR